MDFMNKVFYGNTISDWLLSLSIIIGSLIGAKIIYLLFGKVIKKLAKKTKTKLDDIMVEMLEKPSIQLVVIFGIWFSFNRLNFTETATMWIECVYSVALIFSITWFLVRILDALIVEYVIPLTEKTESDFDDHIVPIVRKALKIIIWGLGITYTLKHIGYDVSTLLAGFGIGGVAIAMASKDTVSNFFGGVTVFVDKPFKMNDRIKIGGFDGTITQIGIRSTKLKTLDNRVVTIPNSKFTDGMIENISSEPNRKNVLKIGLVYDTTAKQLNDGMNLLKDIVKNNDNLEEDSAVGFNEFGDSALGILFVYYIKKGADILGTITDVNMEIKKGFEELGIEMAFPTQTIYTK